jgi:hypothetical protein
LAVELWDDLFSNPDEIPVTEEQLIELQQASVEALFKLELKLVNNSALPAVFVHER